jgi:transposase-like protein
MQRPDLDTLACVNPECHLFCRPGAANLTVRKVYGHDRLRLLRCRTCGEECSERRGRALFNTKRPEATAEDVISHLDEGCSVRATARLVKVAKETVARLLRVTGRHAQRFHNQHVHGLTPKALAFDEQWSFVKKSRSGARRMSRMRQETCGTIRRSRQTVSWSSLSWWANAPKSRPMTWCTMPNVVSVRGICRRSSQMPIRATRRLSSQPLAVVTPPHATALQGVPRVSSFGGRKGWQNPPTP